MTMVDIKLLTAAQESGTKYLLEKRKAEQERDAAKRAIEILAMYIKDVELKLHHSPKILTSGPQNTVSATDAYGLLVPLDLLFKQQISWGRFCEVLAEWLEGKRDWTPDEFEGSAT